MPRTANTYIGPERRRPVLIIQHAEHEHPAALRRALQTQGIQSLWLHPYRGELYPSIESIRGIISLGGPMGANDQAHHPWIEAECALLKQAVEAGLPVAGICLGGQLLAKAMGGRVEKSHAAELGWFPILLNDAGMEDRVLGSAGQNPLVYHWHMDTFHLPPGAELLASSGSCARQAYRLSDRVYGFQFHPEADHQLVHEWLEHSGIELEIKNEQDLHGAHTVQTADQMRESAIKGERGSLKITAGIGQLFKDHDYEDIGTDATNLIENFATHRWEVAIELQGPDRQNFTLIGTIVTLLSIPDGEFMILRDRDTLLWPIRLDYANKITLVSR